MSKTSPHVWDADDSIHHEISIRHEYTRFACMFYLFTLFALLATVFLFVLTNNAYHDQSESVQRRFLPYCVLTVISFILCSIFFLGSLVYSGKLLRRSKSKRIPVVLPKSNDSSKTLLKNRTVTISITEPSETQSRKKSDSRTRTISPYCQTDV